MKTMETTEEVSSDGMEKRVERRKSQRSAPVVRKKLRMDWEKGLQICGAGRKSGKHPTLVVGKKPNGKSRFETLGTSFDIRSPSAGYGVAAGVAAIIWQKPARTTLEVHDTVRTSLADFLLAGGGSVGLFLHWHLDMCAD